MSRTRTHQNQESCRNIEEKGKERAGREYEKARAEREGEGEESRKKREVEAWHCAANAAQTWVIQQRLLWRPTMRLWEAQTAETQRERQEERSQGRGGGGGGRGMSDRARGGTTTQNYLTLISVRGEIKLTKRKPNTENVLVWKIHFQIKT